MTLVNDLDLFHVEPNLFSDASDVALRLLEASDGAVDGTSLSSSGADFEAAGVGVGHVVVVGDEPLEIVSEGQFGELIVTRPRSIEGPLVAPSQGTDLSVAVRSFERFITRSEAWVLGALGVEAVPKSDTTDPSIVNLEDVVALIVSEAIAEVLAALVALHPDDAVLAARADSARTRALTDRSRTVARIDLDGDGEPEATRRMGSITLVRT